jgi:hypothetical protein
MRTTLNLQPSAFELAATYANARAMKLGDAVSELILRNQAPAVSSKLKKVGDVWVMAMPKGQAPISAAQVKQMLEED